MSTIRGLFGKAASMLHLGRDRSAESTPAKPKPSTPKHSPRPSGPRPTPSPKPTPSKPTTPKPTTPKPGSRPAETIGSGPTAIHVEYSPRMDGDPDPGEVVWTWVTYEDDPSQGKDRPVVVIGRRASSLAAVALTSKRHDREPQVLVGTGSWDREGRPSYAKVDRVLDVEPSAMRREGAILDVERFTAVVEGVRRELAR